MGLDSYSKVARSQCIHRMPTFKFTWELQWQNQPLSIHRESTQEINSLPDSCHGTMGSVQAELGLRSRCVTSWKQRVRWSVSQGGAYLYLQSRQANKHSDSLAAVPRDWWGGMHPQPTWPPGPPFARMGVFPDALFQPINDSFP